MRKITMFQCDICKQIYNYPETALNCEAEGKETALAVVGDKVLYRDDWNGGFGTCYDELDVIHVEDKGHFVSYELGDITDGLPPVVIIDGNKEFMDKCKKIE